MRGTTGLLNGLVETAGSSQQTTGHSCLRMRQHRQVVGTEASGGRGSVAAGRADASEERVASAGTGSIMARNPDDPLFTGENGMDRGSD